MAVWTGYKNLWGYHGVWSEKKIKKGVWTFRFVATKNRKARAYGSIKYGDEIHWRFRNVNQRVRKIGKGKYKTVMTGMKYFKGGKF
jgi:hypothetical protein